MNPADRGAAVARFAAKAGIHLAAWAALAVFACRFQMGDGLAYNGDSIRDWLGGLSILDGQLPEHPRLLHHLVVEVLFLGRRARLEDGLEVVEELQDVRPVELRKAQVRRLGLDVGPVSVDLL